MIKTLSSIAQIEQIIPIIKQQFPNTWQGFELMLYRALGSKADLVLLNIIDNRISAYVYVSLITWNGALVAFIQSMASEKGSIPKEVQKAFTSHLFSWCKHKGVYKVMGITKKPIKVFARKYGTRFGGSIVIKDI